MTQGLFPAGSLGKHPRHNGLIAFIAICCAVVAVAPAAAHKEATGIVKERMEMMSALGRTMKGLKAMARASIPVDVAVLSRAVEEMRGHSARFPALFPAGSYASPSEALPVIEARRQEFEALFVQLDQRAVLLAALVEAPEPAALAEWFRATGRVCSACHKTFRGAH